MSEKRKKCNKISLYLIKPNNNIDSLIKDEIRNNVEIMDERANSITYYVKSRLNNPNWLTDYFKKNNEKLIQSNAKVISFHELNIDGESVVFAIPFGNGKSLLKEDVIEDQFGLKVLLNSVDLKSFRQVQTVNCSKNFKTSSEQLPKISSLNDFVFDINSDLMKKATAKCDDEEFYGNMITGGDVLSVNSPYNIDTIEELLIFCYKRYKDTKYLDNFSWIDHIKEVKSKGEREQLDSELINKINAKSFDEVWMAVPENINWENVNCFKFNNSDLGWDDIEITEFINKFNDKKIDNMDQIKNRRVLAISPSGEESYSWPAYKCIMGEIQYNGNAYCYNSGKWYKVDGSFSEKTQNEYDQLELFEPDFPKCINMQEKDYNELLKESFLGSFLMDRKLIDTGGTGHSDIELCDVLTNSNELIHVKKGESSSYLSHLFNQARVSSDFIQDKSFRKRANEKIGIDYFDDNFNTHNYTIVLGIITNKDDDRPKIPFFSKVSIKYMVDDLKRKGYNVKIKNIVNK